MKNKYNSYLPIMVFFMMLISIVNYSKDKPTYTKKSFPFSNNLNLKRDKSVNLKIQNFDFKLDSVKSAKDLKPIKNTAAKARFFGKTFSYGLPSAQKEGPCEVGVFKTFYLFGLKISGPKPVMKPCKKNPEILSQEVVGCGEEYVPEKEKDKLEKQDKKSRKEKKEKKTKNVEDFLDDI